MYNETDKAQINKRLIFYCAVLAVMQIALIVAYVLCNNARLMVPVMLLGALMWAGYVFMCDLFIIPCWRYRRFLNDMETGLTKVSEGTLLGIDEKEDLQDGVRVLPVHIHLKDEEDTRILYVNVSKRDAMPAVGSEVSFSCYGRHIRAVNS